MRDLTQRSTHDEVACSQVIYNRKGGGIYDRLRDNCCYLRSYQFTNNFKFVLSIASYISRKEKQEEIKMPHSSDHE